MSTGVHSATKITCLHFIVTSTCPLVMLATGGHLAHQQNSSKFLAKYSLVFHDRKIKIFKIYAILMAYRDFYAYMNSIIILFVHFRYSQCTLEHSTALYGNKDVLSLNVRLHHQVMKLMFFIQILN